MSHSTTSTSSNNSICETRCSAIPRFAQGKTKLNTSECLCLIDAVCRAILHCGPGLGPLGPLGTLGTVSTTWSDGQAWAAEQTELESTSQCNYIR